MTKMHSFPRRAKSFNTFALEQLRVPVADNVKGTIRVEDLDSDVIVEIPKSVDMRDTDSLQLQWNGDPYGVPLDLANFDLTDPTVVKFDLLIAVADFPPENTVADVRLDYMVYDTASEDGQVSGQVVTIRFDRRAPGGARLPPLYIDEAQLERGITAADLRDDPDDASKKVLLMLVNPYFDEEMDDRIELWLGTSPTSGSYLPRTFTVLNPRQAVAVWIPEEALRALGDGTLYFGYRSTDWAGNESSISALTPVEVYLTLPTLPAPLVPANDDGLITYNDANDPPYHGVGVDIPTYPGATAGDTLIVKWGGQTLPPYTINAAEAAVDPVATIRVPYATVAAEGNGPKNVSYSMERSGSPSVSSPDTPVEVDLTTPGGPDPDPEPENPEHGNILAPEVRCGSSPVNTIAPNDFGTDASATVFRVGKIPPDPIWLIGDVIQLYWGAIGSPEIPPVTIASGNEGANISIRVPFAEVIDVVGVGTIPVFFSITRQLAGNVPVMVKSQEQNVSVASRDALPGDGAPLAEGLFPEANANNIITRAAGLDGTTFRITLSGVSNIELAKNAVVSYDFVGVATGDATALPPGAVPIEPSRVTATDVPITQEMLDAGYLEVPLPYSLTYPICRNGAILDYSIANDLGRTNAIQKFVRFAMNQGGGSCSVPTFGINN